MTLECKVCCTKFCNGCKNFSRSVPLVALLAAILASAAISLFLSALSAIRPDSVSDEELMQTIQDVVYTFISINTTFATVVVFVALFTGCAFGPCRKIFYDTWCKHLMCCCGQVALVLLFLFGVVLHVVEYLLIVVSGILFAVTGTVTAICKAANKLLENVVSALSSSGWGSFAPKIKEKLGRASTESDSYEFDCAPLEEKTHRSIELIIASCLLALSGFLLCVALWGSLKSVQFEASKPKEPTNVQQAQHKLPGDHVSPLDSEVQEEKPTQAEQEKSASAQDRRLIAVLLSDEREGVPVRRTESSRVEPTPPCQIDV
uniref:Transmembrane protein n=1 Tax=Chromera velia CCMP2878 TaxID=1169474 RepID=A0A0G4HIK9_9ALVE|eukprot:Cvel_27828.t1-p1 / transcript=Cvel_27828.t1 / gene=Cvel_27828 / organism=Chromera_velia_CCMP2878 / gene_product=hypothetical protein / transcript_product=hypothetical protein / location=Cvel_scaffold3536:9124-10074(+) / protein_length=317 / sequence_SO=supercontig / SO=protein_coding / is_pseudo=false